MIRCRLILAESNDEFDKTELLRHLATKMPVYTITFDQMLSVVASCEETQRVQAPKKEATQANNHSIDTSQLWNLAHGILPGTLWCGVDDIATEYSQLGKV